MDLAIYQQRTVSSLRQNGDKGTVAPGSLTSVIPSSREDTGLLAQGRTPKPQVCSLSSLLQAAGLAAHYYHGSQAWKRLRSSLRTNWDREDMVSNLLVMLPCPGEQRADREQSKRSARGGPAGQCKTTPLHNLPKVVGCSDIFEQAS